MGIAASHLRQSLNSLVEIEPRFETRLVEIGYPPPRIRDRGYQTLLRTILGQQVSVASANAVWRKLSDALGGEMEPHALLKASDAVLRGAGLSRQKSSYARSLAELIVSRQLDLAALPADDEAAIAELVAVKGIGRWSAEVYLLFAEGRPDIWPAGDLAVRAGVQLFEQLGHMPSIADMPGHGERWRPWRSVAACYLWGLYASHRQREVGI